MILYVKQHFYKTALQRTQLLRADCVAAVCVRYQRTSLRTLLERNKNSYLILFFIQWKMPFLL